MAARSAGPRAAVTLGGNRSPFACANGPFAQAPNQDMLIAALDGLVARFGLSGEALGEVAPGAVPKHSRDSNFTRETVLRCGLAHANTNVQQGCGTSLGAAILVADKIALGQIDSGIAGGVDSASDAPIAVGDGL